MVQSVRKKFVWRLHGGSATLKERRPWQTSHVVGVPRSSICLLHASLYIATYVINTHKLRTVFGGTDNR